MPRRLRMPARHRAVTPWAVLLPFALAACGDGDKAGSTPLVQLPAEEAPAKATPAGGLPARTTPTPSAPRIATYEEAESVFEAKRYGEAKDLFTSYVTAKPENPWGHYMLGISAWKDGDFATAEAAFDRALALDPGHVKSYLNSARVFLELGREHEAIERLQTALQLDSSSSEGLRLLARAHHRTGDIEAALDTYRQALLTNDRDVWAMNNLGVLYLEENDPESGLPPLARAVQLKPNAPVFRNNLGMALERAGFLGAAKTAYEAVLRSDSTYAKARISLDRVTKVLEQPTGPEKTVNLDELAELFRLHIQMWRDTAVTPKTTDPTIEPDSAKPAELPHPAPDSTGGSQ